MKFSIALRILLASGSLKTTTASSTSSTIKDAVGDGCKTSIDFESKFVTEAGDECTTCHFCSGSKLNDMFIPKEDSVCIDCSSSDNMCDTLQIITKFENPWVMEFVSITSSNMDSKFDPAKIVIKGSTDSKSWIKVFDSSEKGEIIFSGRNQKKDFLLSNNVKDLNDYMISLKLNDSSSKLYLKQYGIVEAFTKLCTSNIYKAITGDHITPYKTLAPTSSPTSIPTDVPTDPPTLTNLALKGTATQASTHQTSEKPYDALGSAVASYAIDGNTNGHWLNQNSVAITDRKSPGDWWKVNLNGVFTIQKIIIFNRTDCCTARLGNSDLRIFDDIGNEVATKYIDAAMGRENKLEFDFNEVVGSYVEVKLRGTEYLQLAEVQVFGHMNR